METLCFKGNYTKRFARVKEFCNEQVEVVIDEYIRRFCNRWLEEEYSIQSGAERYERTKKRVDIRGGHYPRTVITKRGVIRLMVPRGIRRKHSYSLFKRFKRKTEGFEHIVAEALLRGHSSRKASGFFKEMFGENTISHQAALQTLRKFDYEVKDWKRKKLRNNAVILVLDGVWLKGVIPCLKGAKPVLFAYAIYADGSEEVLDFELVRGESLNAWTRFCQRLEMRGLKDVRLVVRDDTDAIAGAVALVWPGAQDQLCIFHVLKNFNKKLEGLKDRKLILKHAGELYDAQSEEEFYKRAEGFKNTWIGYRGHPAFRYFFNKLVDTLRYYELPREYWGMAKTTNRLERLFEELKRRIKVFRRFPNPLSCERWLYALLIKLDKINTEGYHESQHSS